MYYFFTTPRGVRYQQSSESSRYQPPWSARAAAVQGGWNAVLSSRSKMSAPGRNSQWRFNFVRHLAAVNENFSWAYDGLMSDLGGGAWPSFTDARFWPALGNVQIATNAAARPQPRAEVYGLQSIGHDRDKFQQANGVFAQQNARDVGVDFTYPSPIRWPSSER